MAENGRGKKHDYGIVSYNPKNKKPPLVQIECPHCWFSHHHKSVVTKHINDEHWDIKKEI